LEKKAAPKKGWENLVRTAPCHGADPGSNPGRRIKEKEV